MSHLPPCGIAPRTSGDTLVRMYGISWTGHAEAGVFSKGPSTRAGAAPGSVLLRWETCFALSQFKQIEQRKLCTECWTGLGNEALVLFTRKGLFLAWVTAMERSPPHPP